MNDNYGKALDNSGPPSVFLGGTCNNSLWRNKLIPLLRIEFFNPVVDNWTPEDALKEEEKKETSKFLLFVVTTSQKGFYSIAELASAAYKYPDKQVVVAFVTDDGDFDAAQKKSNAAIIKLLSPLPNFKAVDTLDEVASYLNNFKSELK